ncbi:MAG: hypothetical protein L0Z53_15220 [Acidobacteriales bacterium]|nr:hypothetical protein [Terriglobales bacterium]
MIARLEVFYKRDGKNNSGFKANTNKIQVVGYRNEFRNDPRLATPSGGAALLRKVFYRFEEAWAIG